VDLRSGGEVDKVVNRTHQRAQKAGKKTSYLHAMPDMRAAMKFARKKFPGAHRYLAWGSSYSAALVLALAGEKPAFADAVLSFSPGEYFSKLGKGKHWVRDCATRIKVPVFITSARKEAGGWKAIFEAIAAPGKASFVPASKGNHGSRALWSRFSDSGDYWLAVEHFLISATR
jgi:hypothetical protein